MAFLYLILFIILSVIILGLTIAAKVLRTLFGFGKRMAGNTASSQTRTQDYRENSSENARNHNSRSTGKPSGKKKFFDKDEGEYVEFEEVKE